MSATTDLGRVVVTGAGGFIGRRLHRALVASGAQVAAWTRRDVDLLDPCAVADAVDRARPDTVFHLAAAGVSAAAAHDLGVLQRDVAMVDALVGALPAGTRLVIAGSMSEYGGSGRHAEGDRCAPRTVYGIAKLASGLHGAAYGGARGISVRIARLFGVYGPGEPAQRFFPSLVDAVRARRPVALSDGLQRRDFIHVDDACLALIGLATATATDAIVNVGTGRAVRVRDVAEWIADAAGAPRALLGFSQRARSPGDEELLEADVTRLVGLLGAAPPQRLGPGLSLDLFAR